MLYLNGNIWSFLHPAVLKVLQVDLNFIAVLAVLLLVIIVVYRRFKFCSPRTLACNCARTRAQVKWRLFGWYMFILTECWYLVILLLFMVGFIAFNNSCVPMS